MSDQRTTDPHHLHEWLRLDEAYHKELDRYIVPVWESAPVAGEVMDDAALQRLGDARSAVDKAKQAYLHTL